MGAPVVHFEVNGKDYKVLTEFYSKLFGWAVHEAMPGQYGLVHTEANGRGIDGGIGGGGQDGPGVVFYVEVDDPQKALEQAEALGGKVVTPVTPMEMVTFAHFADPEGHVIGILKSGEQDS
jgi:predicted enzyme related to lactoylglutathione lyase